MAGLVSVFKRFRPAVQPSNGGRINWSHPLTRGLQVCLVPHATGVVDAVDNIQCISQDGAYIGARGDGQFTGYYAATPETATAIWKLPIGGRVRVPTTADLSMFAVGYTNTPTTSGRKRLFKAMDNSANTSAYGIDLVDTSYKRPCFFMSMVGGGYLGGYITGETTENGKLYSLGLWCPADPNTSADVGMVMNGQRVPITMTLSSYTTRLYDITQAGLCGGDTSGSIFGGAVIGMIWDRLLSDAEWKALHENPWQIFVPDLPQFRFFDPQGQTFPTVRRWPLTILSSTNLSGVVASIQDDPAAPDGNWLVMQ